MMRNLFTISSLFSVIILASGISVSSNAHAEQTLTLKKEGFPIVQSNGQSRFSGRLDGINDHGKKVVINDTLIDVNPIITVDGVSVSRERLRHELEDGQKLEFMLSGDSESNRLTEIVTR